MSREKIAIIGAGGFGREIYHILFERGHEVVGFIDNQALIDGLPVAVIGNDDEIQMLMDNFDFNSFFVAIGDISKRRKIVQLLHDLTPNYPEILHPTALIYSSDIGNGTVIYPKSVVMNDCRIGSYTLVNSGVTIGHDVTIGDFCNINPGVNLAGRVSVGSGSMIGIGACVRENVSIGNNVVIGAGSVVLNDIPDGVTAYGIPARVQHG